MKCDTCGVTIYGDSDCFNGECEKCFNMTEDQWYEFLNSLDEEE